MLRRVAAVLALFGVLLHAGASVRHQSVMLDAQRQPVFMYRVGAVDVEEQAAPALREGGVSLLRRFKLAGQPPAAGKLYVLTAAGAKIEPSGAGEWKVDDTLTVKVKADGVMPVVRERGTTKQLVVPIELRNGAPATVEVELKG